MWKRGSSPKQKIYNSDMDGLAIIISGNTATKNVSTGDYVLVENSTISGVTDGGYKAAANVSAGTAFTSANLTALSKGAANAIGADVATLNSKIENTWADYGNRSGVNALKALNGEYTPSSNGFLVVVVQQSSTSSVLHYQLSIGLSVIADVQIGVGANDIQTLVVPCKKNLTFKVTACDNFYNQNLLYFVPLG